MPERRLGGSPLEADRFPMLLNQRRRTSLRDAVTVKAAHIATSYYMVS
jgi:hypothetical protein